MMYGYGYGPGYAGGWQWLMIAGMALFGLLLVIGIVLLVYWASRRPGMGGHPHGMAPGAPGAPGAPMSHPGDPALAVLRERLARGEITPEEYEKTAKVLGG